MAENAGALIRRTKKLTVSGFCALAIGAGMLGGGTGIANADQIGADPVVTAGPSNVESETRGVVTAGDMGVVSASGGAEARVAVVLHGPVDAVFQLRDPRRVGRDRGGVRE